MATVRDYRTVYRNVVKLTASLVGVSFKFEYRSMGMGGDVYRASYDGENLVNCAFGMTEDGAEDKSVVVVPINYIKIAPASGAYVKRTFKDSIVETEMIMPNDGGDYMSRAGYSAGGSLEDVESIKSEVREMLGNDPESESAKTPQIDNNKEVQSFLEGYDNTQKLKDVMPKPMTEEEYQAIRDSIK